MPKSSVATELAYEPNFVSPNFDDRPWRGSREVLAKYSQSAWRRWIHSEATGEKRRSLDRGVLDGMNPRTSIMEKYYITSAY